MTETERDPSADLPWPESPAPSPELTAAIRKRCTTDLEPKRGLSANQRALISVLVSGAVVGILLALRFKRGGMDEPLQLALIGAVLWGGVHAAILFFGLVRPPGRRGSRTARIAVAVALPLIFFAWLALAATDTLPLGHFIHQGVGRMTHCSAFALLFGGLATVGTLLAWRRTDPVTPELSGALVGLCGGLASSVGMGIACPTHEGWHLWFAHGLTLVLFVVGGWALGRRWMRP